MSLEPPCLRQFHTSNLIRIIEEAKFCHKSPCLLPENLNIELHVNAIESNMNVLHIPPIIIGEWFLILGR